MGATAVRGGGCAKHTDATLSDTPLLRGRACSVGRTLTVWLAGNLTHPALQISMFQRVYWGLGRQNSLDSAESSWLTVFYRTNNAAVVHESV